MTENQNNQQGSLQGNQERQGSTSPKGETNTSVSDEEENDEESTDSATSIKSGSQNSKKENK